MDGYYHMGTWLPTEYIVGSSEILVFHQIETCEVDLPDNAGWEKWRSDAGLAWFLPFN